MCPTTDIHRDVCFSHSGGPLQEVHQGVHMYSTAPQQVPCQGRGQQEVRACVTYRRGHEGLQSIETSMHDSSHLGVLLITPNHSCWRLMCQKTDWVQADRWYHPIAYGSRALMPHKKNYHSTKLKFLALKWAVTKHFNKYLSYQSFVVWMDNNPLTYIMSNLIQMLWLIDGLVPLHDLTLS